MDFVYVRSCSGTGNMQLPYNSPDGCLVHVLFSQCVYFPTALGGLPENPGTDFVYFVSLHFPNRLLLTLPYRCLASL